MVAARLRPITRIVILTLNLRPTGNLIWPWFCLQFRYAWARDTSTEGGLLVSTVTVKYKRVAVCLCYHQACKCWLVTLKILQKQNFNTQSSFISISISNAFSFLFQYPKLFHCHFISNVFFTSILISNVFLSWC